MMKKTIKKVFIGLLILIVCLVGYYYSRKIELTKVSLKCTETMMMIEDKPVKDYYFKITRKIYHDKPYKIYGSHPDTDDENYLPVLVGVSVDSSEGRNIKFKREQYSPNWYTFVDPDPDWDRPIPRLSIVTYVNRESLNIENRFTDTGKVWSKGQCSIIPNEKFDEVWTEQVKKLKEKMKF